MNQMCRSNDRGIIPPSQNTLRSKSLGLYDTIDARNYHDTRVAQPVAVTTQQFGISTE